MTITTEPVHLVVYGFPAPQGSKKPMGRNANGSIRIVENSPKVAPWRADVKAACEAWMVLHPEHIMFTCALQVGMVFTLLRPPSVPRRKRPFPSVPPDVVKLARSTEDAITASGLWEDDKLVCSYSRLEKVYAGEDPRALNRSGCQIWIEAKIAAPIPMGPRLVQPLAIEGVAA